MIFFIEFIGSRISISLPSSILKFLEFCNSLDEHPTQSIRPEIETFSLTFSTVIAWSLEGASLILRK